MQPDGKMLIGGSFSSVLGVARNNIARLNTNGSLDGSFNPNANGEINAIAVQADGKILVGGNFAGANSIGGQMRNRIARLDPTTGQPDSFDPNANGLVEAIAVQPDGKILVSGGFNGANSIGGQSRNHLARLDPISGLADSFDPNAMPQSIPLRCKTDGKILAAGDFQQHRRSQMRSHIARLDPASGAGGFIRIPTLTAMLLQS